MDVRASLDNLAPLGPLVKAWLDPLDPPDLQAELKKSEERNAQ